MNITLVEDDPIQQRVLQQWLNEAGYRCRILADGSSLISQFHHTPVDLLLLDWELPDQSGLDLLQWLRRQHGHETPVLFLTMRDDEADVVAALRGGADDYLTKPARKQELLARIEANLRRSHAVGNHSGHALQIGPFTLHEQSRQIDMHGKPLQLTQKEFGLAHYLLTHLGQIISRKDLLKNIWGHKGKTNSRTVDTHISRVRKKLSLHPEQGWRLSSIYQAGYRLDWLGEEAHEDS